MSKRDVLFLVVGIVLMILGVLVGLTRGWDYTVGNVGNETIAAFEPGQVTAVEAKTEEVEIRIYENWNETAEVDIEDLSKSRISVTLEGSTLVLREKKATFPGRLFGGDGCVILWLPAGGVTEVQAFSSSGDVTLSGLVNPEMAVSLTSSSGDAGVYDTQAASLAIQSASGYATAGEVRLTGDLRAGVSSGTVSLVDVRCAAAQAESSSGNIWLDDVRAGTVTLSASSGSVIADELEASDVTAWTSSGSVDLELEGRREDYTVFMSTSSGSVSGVQPGGDGDRILTVSTSSGSINVSFTE